jgi:hypothetical protein
MEPYLEKVENFVSFRHKKFIFKKSKDLVELIRNIKKTIEKKIFYNLNFYSLTHESFV